MSELVERLDRGDEAGALALARSMHVADLAEAVAGLDERVRALVAREFTPAEIAELLEYLEPRYRELLLAPQTPAEIAEIVAEAPDDIATDVVQELSGSEAAEVVAAIPPEAQQAIRELVGYAPESAAGRMTGLRVTVPGDEPVERVIERLRAQPTERMPAIYALDADGKLAGVVNLRALLIAEPGTRVGELAEATVTVPAETDQEEAARLLKQYNVAALAVVDADGQVLGTLTADDVLDVLEDEVTEDMFRMAGVNEGEALESVAQSVRFRLPWLYANLVTVLAAAWVVSLFEGTLARVAVLAAFLPVVAGQGGNAGIQTVTVVVRSLALGRIAPRNALRVMRHELTTGAITGLASGVAVGAVAWLWQGNVWLGALVATALVGDVLVGVLAGVLIPVALHAARQDPALSANIWLTTVTDVCGFFLYLGLATTFVARL